MKSTGLLFLRLSLAGFFIGAMPMAGWAQLRINEVMADNISAVETGVDVFPDWVEIINLGASPVSLNNHTLTDDATIAKYRFPAGLTVGAGQRVVVYSDDLTNAPGIHGLFGLNNNGEHLRLFNGLTLVDQVVFGIQLPDQTIGRVPDGSGTWTLTDPTPGETNEAIVLGDPVFLRINEWMADPSSGEDWFEIYNLTNRPVPLGGLLVSDILATPNLHQIRPLSFIGIGDFAFTVFDANDETNSANEVPFKLGAGGDSIWLRFPNSTIIDTVTFGAQVEDVSQARLPDGAELIVSSDLGKATKGESNFITETNVVFNEVLSHADDPLEDAVEILNISGQPFDIGGYWLSDNNANPKKYRIPSPTVIQPGGFKVFYQATFGFGLTSFRDEEINLFSADAAGNLTGRRVRETFGASPNNVSFGRRVNSDGDIDFVLMPQTSFGQDNPGNLAVFRTGTGLTNPLPRVGPVIISEIMYHPEDIVEGTNSLDNTVDEFVELRNISTVPQPLYDPLFPTNSWELTEAVRYTFLAGTVLAPGEPIVVVSFNPTNTTLLNAFKARYGVDDNARIVGPFRGSLKNSSESVRLVRPDEPETQGPGAGITPYYIADRVTYDDAGAWPTAPDGSGMSLERIIVESYSNEPAHWRGSIPTPGGRALAITNYGLSGNSMIFQFQADAGSSYTVLFQDELNVPADWQRLADAPASAASTMRQVMDPNVPAVGSRFYQIVSPQR